MNNSLSRKQKLKRPVTNGIINNEIVFFDLGLMGPTRYDNMKNGTINKKFPQLNENLLLTALLDSSRRLL